MTKSILLVHPLGYNSQSASKDISRLANIMPPLGLASIAAYLHNYNIQSRIVDCYANPDSYGIIEQLITAEKPDFIGLSCTTSSFYDGLSIARKAKEVSPSIKTVFGGAHVSSLKEDVLRGNNAIDLVVVGEGEETMLQLLNTEGNDYSSVLGLVYRDGDGEPRFTGFRKSTLDLDSLPFPAYEKLAGYPDVYKLPIFNYPQRPNASCISSRGCPYACSYCDRSVFGRSFRYNSADYMYRHLKYLSENFGIKHVNFYDDQFTFNQQRIKDFAALMISKPLGMTFNCAARAEHLDPELLSLMKRAGCWMISIGIETGDEDLLAQHRRNADLMMILKTVRMIKQAGIRIKGLLMMGLPGESEDSIKKSKKYTFSLNLDDFNLSKFTPFPGSPIYDKIKAAPGELGSFDENWEKMDCMEFVFIPKGMTKERLEELFIDFYRTHFMQIRTIIGFMTMLWKSPDSWRRFLKNLTAFLKFAKSNNRIG